MEMMVAAGISLRYHNAKMTDISGTVLELFKDFGKGESYFIYGGVGTGKTHLAAALIRGYLEKRPVKKIKFQDGQRTIQAPLVPRIVSVPDLLMEIRQVFSGRSEKTEGGLIKDYGEYRTLFLDDIGVEKATEWALQTLYTIVDNRYREMRQTIITSNLDLNALASRVGDRIVSRITGMCKIVNLRGKDRRLK